MYSENTLWFLLHSEYPKKLKSWFWRVGTGVRFNNHTPSRLFTTFELKQYLIPLKPRFELTSSQIQVPRTLRIQTFSQPPGIHGMLIRYLARSTHPYSLTGHSSRSSRGWTEITNFSLWATLRSCFLVSLHGCKLDSVDSRRNCPAEHRNDRHQI